MGHYTQPLRQFNINWLTLSFPSEIEHDYHLAHFQKSLIQIRIALLLGVFFYAIFGILDLLIFPEVASRLWFIRYAIVIPYMLLMYAISYTKWYINYMHFSTASVVLIAGFGIIGMIVISPAPTNNHYYAGLLLVIFYGYTFFKTRFIWATLAGWSIVLAYEIVALNLMDSQPELLLSNNFFFLAGNLIGLFASYSIEISARRDFIQTDLLEQEKVKFEQLNEDLENRVEQRTLQLRQANKDLRAEFAERKDAEEKYRTLFERSKDGVFISTPNGRFIDLNPAGIELFGYANKDEVLDVDISREIYVHSEVREEFQRQIEKHGHVKDFQNKCRRKDGKIIDVLETATALLDKDKNIIAYQGIIRDVTGKLELERELIQSQKMESIGLLAGGIAHDLNNVLTPVTMSIELLREKTSDLKALGFLDSIEINAKRGADIVKQLLTFARRTGSEFSVMEPRLLIIEVLDIVEHTFPKTIQTEAIIDPDLHTISGDSTQLHQVLLNLCLNARDAMPDGGKILIKAKNSVIPSDQASRKINVEAGNYIEISVQDTGKGIPRKLLDKIFEPFFTTKQVGEGTGLGLSVIHSIIDGHGGIIDVQSQVGKGSTFSIFLPESGDISKASTADEIIKIQRGNHELILVVDDEESILLMMTEILSNYDYKVLTADNGLEAINMVRENKDRIDVIISDMLMPGIDGATTIKEMRKISKDVPIVTMSGLSVDTAAIDKRLGRNIQASLAKPFSAPDLLRTIADVLGSAR